jgi:hypothetical protein
MRNNECIYMKQLKAFYPFCFTGYTHIVNSVVWAMHYYLLHFVLCLLSDKAVGIRLLFKYCVLHLLGTKLRLRYDYCCQMKLKQGCIWNLKLKNNNFDHVT